MIVTLIGLRGSGKSAVARPLAQRLGCEAVDADDEVERVAGRSIKEVFAKFGEGEFRRIEREVVVDLLTRDRLVIASGGGSILDERTRADMRAAGPVCWLRASPETLAARVAADDSSDDRRPRLAGDGVLAEMRELSERRESLYTDAATIVVDTEGRSPDEIAASLFESITATVEDGGRA